LRLKRSKQEFLLPYHYDLHDGQETMNNPAEKRFVLRGGGWWNRPINLHTSSRFDLSPDSLSKELGFRLIRYLPDER
jgi:formylglycine-generating enzyme required for sulfatase activity